ncbi:MAG: hypothetical protein AAFQ02_12300, partial [Bacteroidota bacterium]
MKEQQVLVCETQYLSREGLKSIIGRNPFYAIAGEASSSDELEAKLNIKSYDVVTIDITKDGPFGIDSISLIHDINPATNIIV